MSREILHRKRELPPELEAQLRALDGNPDLIDIPEAPQENWAKARRFHAAPPGRATGQPAADGKERAGARRPAEPAKP